MGLRDATFTIITNTNDRDSSLGSPPDRRDKPHGGEVGVKPREGKRRKRRMGEGRNGGVGPGARCAGALGSDLRHGGPINKKIGPP